VTQAMHFRLWKFFFSCGGFIYLFMFFFFNWVTLKKKKKKKKNKKKQRESILANVCDSFLAGGLVLPAKMGHESCHHGVMLVYVHAMSEH
jgi:hypothetical protein